MGGQSKNRSQSSPGSRRPLGQTANPAKASQKPVDKRHAQLEPQDLIVTPGGGVQDSQVCV